jgi:hypothetical protein
MFVALETVLGHCEEKSQNCLVKKEVLCNIA